MPGGAAGSAGSAVIEGVPCEAEATAQHDVWVLGGLVIPVGDVRGGTGLDNNAKKNPGRGYFSLLDDISQFSYPPSHGNQWGSTALVNDHVYWDTEGLVYTHAPPPDLGAGNALLWPAPGEWASYLFRVATPGNFRVLTRFSSGWGPAGEVLAHFTIDGVTSGSFTLTPDDPKIWQDTYYQVGGWWGHTITNATAEHAWALGEGCHLLTFQLDSMPAAGVTGEPSGHGDVWVHYFKVVAQP